MEWCRSPWRCKSGSGPFRPGVRGEKQPNRRPLNAEQRPRRGRDFVGKPKRLFEGPVALQRVCDRLALSKGCPIDPPLQPQSMPENRHGKIAPMEHASDKVG